MISCAISLVTVRLILKEKKELNLLLVALALHGVPAPCHPLDGADVNLDRVCYIFVIVMAKIKSRMSTSLR